MEAASPQRRSPGVPIQSLHAIGLAERRADRGVVERGEDPLASGLPYPVGRPQGHLAGVEPNAASGAARSPISRPTACGWILSGLRASRPCVELAFQRSRALAALAKKLSSVLIATQPRSGPAPTHRTHDPSWIGGAAAEREGRSST